MLKVTLKCLTPHLGLAACAGHVLSRQAWHVCLELDCLLPAACAGSKPGAHAASMMRTVQAGHLT